MPTDLQYLIPLKPKNAIEYFEKKVPLESWRYEEIWQESQAKAFTVAKSTNMNILSDIQAELNTALNEGTTLQEFKNNLVPTLTSKGWLPKIDDTVDEDDEKAVSKATAKRLDTIYHTNMNVAYSAGTYKSLVEASSILPYWKYVAIKDGRTRPEHLQFDGLIFHHTHPFWQNFYPPNDWGCRCDVVAVSTEEALASGKLVNLDEGEITWSEELVSPATGELKDVSTFSVNVDGEDISLKTGLGWSYNAGAAGIVENDTYAKALTMPIETRYAYLSDMSKQPSLYPELFDGFVERAVNSNAHQYEIIGGYIPTALVDTLVKSPKTASIVLRDTEINAAQDIIDLEDLNSIPDYIENNDGVYEDEESNIFFVKNINGNKTMKIPVEINREDEENRRVINYLSTPSYVNPNTLVGLREL